MDVESEPDTTGTAKRLRALLSVGKITLERLFVYNTEGDVISANTLSFVFPQGVLDDNDDHTTRVSKMRSLALENAESRQIMSWNVASNNITLLFTIISQE